MNRLTSLSFVLLLVLTGTGCDGFGDFVDDPLGDFQLQLQITDTRIELGDAFVLPIIPGEPRAAERTIGTGLDVQSVDEIRALTFQPSAFAFTPVGLIPGAPAPSGTLRLYAAIGGYPLPGTPIEVQIVSGAVSSVTPLQVATPQSTLNPTQIDAFFASVPAESRPALAAYQSLSTDQVLAELAVVLSDPSVRLAFGTDVESSDPDNPLAGTLDINSFQISAVVTP